MVVRGGREGRGGEGDTLVLDLQCVGLVLGEIGGVALEGLLDRHRGWCVDGTSIETSLAIR